MAKSALTLLLLVACAASAMAYPSFWPGRAPNCQALPTAGIACHKAPQDDKKSTISLFAAGAVTAASKPLAAICAGKTYSVQVKFPEARLAYLTAGSVGAASARIATSNALNTKCPNTMVFAKPTGFSASTSFNSVVTAPAAAGPWTVWVASASGGCAHYQITRATFTVAKC